ncbi:helix-turn-helix transcriptional regulator [uncultured Oxalicibacterium sp.]|uniref:helix-turn-helix domain-containing protein n=1 Tax=uncultured Oxalicibacterium sp. TaxID=1168540 RepID=UPI0025DFFCAA|nr:helix-turn-helix transcriptional regulator [uncultured Oxalicibacterium sp.]
MTPQKSTLTPLGRFILDRRAELAMQQVELAQRIGVHATYLSTIETGGKTPSKVDFLERLAKGLELNGEEKEVLFAEARKSRRSITLPRNLPLTGYEVVDHLVGYLDGANEQQLAFLKTMLEGLKRMQRNDHLPAAGATSSLEEVKM